jgi:probable aminopeptidase NPEPL1
MCGMKTDMGGSAAILSAFEGLVKSKFQGQVAAILCIAENAIGPKSYKNDDIVTSYSGKTMEVGPFCLLASRPM